MAALRVAVRLVFVISFLELIVPAAFAGAPQIAVTQFPVGILHLTGSEAPPDSFVLANAGPGAASITVVPSNNFFTVQPSTFTLAEGASATVSITVASQAPGFNDGSANVYVAGNPTPLSVPVRAFVTPLPQGPGVVTFYGAGPGASLPPTALSNTIVIYGPPGSTHVGSVVVTNPGGATMQGALIPRAAWLVPQGGLASIDASKRVQLPFAVEPSRRPDAAFPIGAAVGDTSFLYFSGVSPSGAPQTSNLNIQVFDISKASPAPSQPPPLAPGETALFLPLTSIGFFTDVFLSNQSKAAFASDIKLFFTPVGSDSSSSLLSNLGKFPSGSAAWFPFALTSLFGVGTSSGVLHLRSGDPEKVSAAAIRGVVPDGVNKYLTWMPVLRSDRAIPSTDRLILSGVEKSAGIHTDIFLQEVAGFADAYTIDYFDETGKQIAPSSSGTLLPFGYLPIGNAVPTGARSARVTNTGNGAGRITGYATVVDESTFDTFIVIDASRDPGPTSELIIPVPRLAAAPSATALDAYITNGSSSPAQVTVSTSAHETQPVRERAVSRHSGAPQNPAGTSITLAAGETRKVPITSAPLGYVRILGPAGAIGASGRLTSTISGRLGTFGTGIPATPAARAAGLGVVKRFSRANDPAKLFPNAEPPTLLLIETTGYPATVRVTAGYSFPGALVSSEISKTFDVAGGQRLAIADVVRSLYGPNRDTLGTLTNLVVNVEVVAGSGKILSYLQTIDTSGDLTFSSN